MCIFPFVMSSSPDAIKIRLNDSVMTVTPSGDLDLLTAPALAAVLEKTVDRGVREVRVVMRDVAFIDSTGLSALLRRWHAANRAGVRFRLTEATDAVERVLRITQTRRLFVDGDH
jgi:anti-sigma B factor antagonist